jgi:hypothetical protein
MRRTIALLLALGAVLAVAISVGGAATADEIPLAVKLTNGQCQQQPDNSLICTGSLTGLGSQTADVHVTSGFACQNLGGNQPPGQVSGEENGVKPDSNGNATFTVPTNAASCHDSMTPIFTGTAQCAGEAQVDVTQTFSNRTKTTTFCVPIT